MALGGYWTYTNAIPTDGITRDHAFLNFHQTLMDV